MYNFTLLTIDASKNKKIPWESFLMKTNEFPFSVSLQETMKLFSGDETENIQN